MRSFLLAVVMLFALPAWAETRDPATHFFQPKFGDLQADLSEAKKQGKKGIFLFFEMDDCPFCARMKSTILNQADVQDAYRANFLL
ncbi:MAG: thioredoxin family protein, partial [Thiobacillus sp.]|nr:thioredoxin family protein [Thiobacillus sp.]